MAPGMRAWGSMCVQAVGVALVLVSVGLGLPTDAQSADGRDATVSASASDARGATCSSRARTGPRSRHRTQRSMRGAAGRRHQARRKRGGPCRPSRSFPPATGGYLRGVNSYTFAYASSDPAYRGEPSSSYVFLASRGVKMVRLPFYWGMLQPTLGGPLDARYLTALRQEVNRIKSAGMSVVLDLHNSCRWPMYDSKAVCGNGITRNQAADVWRRLSDAFKDEQAVVAYDLMNEPYEMPASTWESFSQAMVSAVRSNGDAKTLWIEGSAWSAVEAFAERHPRAWIRDPADNLVYSAHQYFEYAGRYERGFDYDSYSAEMRSVIPRLRSFTNWLAANEVQGSIGEVGWPSADSTTTWRRWNAIGERWYSAADKAGLSVAYFSVTSAYDEKNAAYEAPHNAFNVFPGISDAQSQASVIEAHPSR